MFAAVGSVYANMFNFSGRARRAEYWWFQLFIFLAVLFVQIGVAAWFFTRPDLAVFVANPNAMDGLLKEYDDQILRWSGIGFAAYLFLVLIPQFAVTVRRLHDTGRSGWWMLKLFLLSILGGVGLAVLGIFLGGGTPEPVFVLMSGTFGMLAGLWFFVVLCLPGNYGDNRFGPDPVPGRVRPASGHPALVKEMDEELGRQVAERRKEEFQDYYRARVLPAIERNKARRVSPQ
jgi:uncharacterized membrane protein YhaH (DUF805 family)